MDTRSFACNILSKCEKHEVWTWQRHLYDASFQSFNDQNQCTTMNHISRIRKIITTLARIRLPSHQHEQQFSYKKNKIFYYKFFFFFFVVIFFFQWLDNLLPPLNTSKFTSIVAGLRFYLGTSTLYYIYLIFTKMYLRWNSKNEKYGCHHHPPSLSPLYVYTIFKLYRWPLHTLQ